MKWNKPLVVECSGGSAVVSRGATAAPPAPSHSPVPLSLPLRLRPDAAVHRRPDALPLCRSVRHVVRHIVSRIQLPFNSVARTAGVLRLSASACPAHNHPIQQLHARNRVFLRLLSRWSSAKHVLVKRSLVMSWCGPRGHAALNGVLTARMRVKKTAMC